MRSWQQESLPGLERLSRAFCPAFFVSGEGIASNAEKRGLELSRTIPSTLASNPLTAVHFIVLFFT